MLSCVLLALAAVAHGAACTDHLALDGDIVDRHVEMIDDPLLNFDAVMIPTYNGSAIEDWSHDATSADGKAGLAFTSSRGSIGGVPGAQRVFIAAVWPNGTRYMENVFTEESNVRICPDKTIARWYNSTSDDVQWEFEYSADYNNTRVTIDSPTVSGTIEINSLVPALYPNGLEYPNPNGNTLFAPLLYWVENVPTGVIEANLTILGSPFTLQGYGGRERNWLPLSWGDSSQTWDMMRGVVGPYRYIGWAHESRIHGFQYSMTLIENEKVVFRTESLEPSDSLPWGTVTKRYHGPVHLTSAPGDGLPNSTFTGYTIDMNSPETGEHWKFDVDFAQTVYWFGVRESVFLGGYTANLTGGAVGGCQYLGLGSGNAQELIL